MIEKEYKYKLTGSKIVERIVSDDNVDINHMVLQKGEELPVHYSNSNVYLIIVRGIMSISLSEQEPASYSKGSIINIPYKMKMHILNEKDDALEFFVVKAPSPKVMKH
jgi:quercetin dioxygenase-like cupin family protein